MEKRIRFHGTCSSGVKFKIGEDNIISDIEFNGGCNGNAKGLAALCDGMHAGDIIKKLKNIKCGFRKTSCPDQFAKALEDIIYKNDQ